MKNIFTLFAILISISLHAQHAKWKVNMDAQKVFIENKSQFDEPNNFPGSTILFATEDGPAQVIFTKNGLTYRLEKRERVKIDEDKEREGGMSHEEIEKSEHEAIITSDVIHMQWKNSNPDAEIVALNPVEHHYNYKGKSNSINARAFQKLIYKNLYSNIDVEYVFHPDKGIEYNFILHPGADATQIQMLYSDVSNMYLDNEKNLHLPTLFGDIIEYAPQTYYATSHDVISSQFELNEKTVSFKLADYNTSQEVVIDPWIVTPSMPNSNRIFCIEADSSGNAYIYGGDSPFKLQKYNISGALQWTFTNGWDSSAYWFGTLIVDRAGNSYITGGTPPDITKVNTSGGQVWTNSGGFADEYWSMAFNCDETQLLIGGTRLTGFPIITGSGRAYTINLSNGAVLNSVKVSDATPSFIINDANEIRSVCSSPDGNYYFITLDTIGSLTQGLAINWRSLSGYRFGYGSPDYGFTPQGQNIIRATATHLYTANGDSIVKRDINTGIVVAAATIPGGGHATTFFVPGTLPKNGGMAIDACGNIYVGSQQNVAKFDVSLNFISSTTTPSAVYDVAIGKNGDVLACGNGFATALNFPACGQLPVTCGTATIAAFASSDTSFCEKQCIDFFDLSTNNPTSWQWTFTGAVPPTDTVQNPTNICYNNYGSFDVQLIACNASGCDTILLANFINELPQPAPPVITISGDTLTSSPAVAYQWYLIPNAIPGAISQSYITTQPGTYYVITTDTNGCISVSDTIAITGLINHNGESGFVISPNPANDEIEITYPKQIKGETELKLIDASGRILFHQVEAQPSIYTRIKSGNLNSGIYYIQIIADDKQMVFKVVIEK